MASSASGPRARAAPLVCAAAGLAGLLPGAAGARDPVALLAWLALVALGAGWLVGASARRARARALLVPLAWAAALALAARDGRAPAHPLLGLAAATGLYLVGHALGSLCGRPWAGAGACVLVALVASGAAVQGGFEPDGRGAETSWAAERPAAARAALALSPLVLVLESAGLDLTHVHPRFYRSSGVEWFPRRPPRAGLAAAASLVVGSLAWTLGALCCRRRGSRAPDDAA